MDIENENEDASPGQGDVDVELVDQETLRIQDIVPTLPFFWYNNTRRTLGFSSVRTPVQFEYYFRPCVTGAIHKNARGVENGILLPDIILNESFENLLNFLNIPYSTTDTTNLKISPEIRLIRSNHLQKYIEFVRIVEEHINLLINPYLQQPVPDNRNDNEPDYFGDGGGNSSLPLEQPDENNQAVQNVDNDGTNRQGEPIDQCTPEDGSSKVEESSEQDETAGSVPRAKSTQSDSQNILGEPIEITENLPQQDQNANVEQINQLAPERHRNAQEVTEPRRKRKTESNQKAHLSFPKRAMLSDSTTELQPGTSRDPRPDNSGDTGTTDDTQSGDPPPGISSDHRPGKSDDTRSRTSNDPPAGISSDSPGKSGDPRPGTSGDSRPSADDNSRPGTSGAPQPGKIGGPRPGKIGGPRPGTSGDPRSDSSGTQNQQIQSSEDDILNRNVDFPKYRANIIFTPDLYGQANERRVSTESSESVLSPDVQQGIMNSLATHTEEIEHLQDSEEHSSDNVDIAEELRKKVVLYFKQYKTLTIENIRKCMKELKLHRMDRDIQERALRNNMYLLELTDVTHVFEGYILKYLQTSATTRNVAGSSSLPEQQLLNPGIDPLLENVSSTHSDSSSDLE